MLRNTTVLVLVLMVCKFSNAAGFGFKMGEAPESYSCDAIAASPGYYECAAPKPHSAFESYIISASKEHGICWVKGIGKNISDNGYGTHTKSAHENLETLLSKAYGSVSKMSDFILPNSLWDDSNEWLMSIARKERVYTSIWNDLEVTSKPDLKSIYLASNATGGKTGYIVLEYYAKYQSDCKRANAESESNAL